MSCTHNVGTSPREYEVCTHNVGTRLDFRPFKVADLWHMRVQERHEMVRRAILATDHAHMLEGPLSWTAVEKVCLSPDHVRWNIAACAGVYIPKDARYPAMAWAFLGTDHRRNMVSVTRAVRTALDACPRPVFTEIDEDFPAAVRWAKLLGFSRFARWIWVYDHRIQ